MNKFRLSAAMMMAQAAAANLQSAVAKDEDAKLKPDDGIPPLPEGCERDPRLEPKVGDMLHVRVLLGARRPKPMTVIDVTKYKVYWQRAGSRYNTDIRFWKKNWVIQHAEVLAVAP